MAKSLREAYHTGRINQVSPKFAFSAKQTNIYPKHEIAIPQKLVQLQSIPPTIPFKGRENILRTIRI